MKHEQKYICKVLNQKEKDRSEAVFTYQEPKPRVRGRKARLPGRPVA